jgi:hypothetical protein
MLLGRWCITQRQLYKNGRLTDEQIDLLNSIGFVWDVNEEIWNATLEQVKEFYALNKRFPVKTTRLAGGLHCPYKGLLPVSACKRSE